MLKDYKLILSVIVGILIGVCLNLFIKKYSTLHIESNISFEINPLEIFSILINIFLAIYITRNLSKQNDLEKTEKELLINYLKEFQIEFSNKIDKLIESTDFETPITNSCFKTLRTRIYSILKLAEENNLTTNADETSAKIKQKISDIWELFTDTPRNASQRTNQATKDGIAVLRLEKISKIEATSIEFDELIFQLIIKINRR